MKHLAALLFGNLLFVGSLAPAAANTVTVTPTIRYYWASDYSSNYGEPSVYDPTVCRPAWPPTGTARDRWAVRSDDGIHPVHAAGECDHHERDLDLLAFLPRARHDPRAELCGRIHRVRSSLYSFGRSRHAVRSVRYPALAVDRRDICHSSKFRSLFVEKLHRAGWRRTGGRTCRIQHPARCSNCRRAIFQGSREVRRSQSKSLACVSPNCRRCERCRAMAKRERLRRLQVLGDRFPDGQLLQREQPSDPVASSWAGADVADRPVAVIRDGLLCGGTFDPYPHSPGWRPRQPS